MGMMHTIKKIVSVMFGLAFVVGTMACMYVSLEGIFLGNLVLTMPLVYTLLFATIVVGILWAVFTDSLEKPAPASDQTERLTEAQAQKIFG